MKKMACALALAAGTGVVVGPAAQSALADPTFAKLATGLQLSLASPGLLSSDAASTFDVTYRGGTIRSVEVYVDNSRVFKQSIKSTDSFGNFSLKLDSSLLLEGDHDVMVVATEPDGSTATSSIKVHVAGPQVDGVAQFAYPRRNSMVQNTVPIELKLDPSIKAPYVAYLLDNEFLSIRNYAPYVYNWDSTKVADGPHTIGVEVYDSNTQELIKKMTIQVVVKNVGGFTTIQPTAPKAVAPKTASSAIREIIGEAISSPTYTVAEDAGSVAHMLAAPASTYTLRGAEPRTGTLFARSATRPEPIIPADEPRYDPSRDTRSAIAAPMPSAVTHRPMMLALPALIAEPEPAINVTSVGNEISRLKLAPVHTGNIAVRPGAALTRRTVAPMFITPFLTPPVAYIKSHRVNGLRSFDVAFNNTRIAFDVAPRVDHGMPLAPFRAIFEHGGGSVRWYGQSQTIRAVSANRQIEFRIGEKTALVNNRVVKLAYAPYVDHGRTIVPVTFVSDAMNVNVTYDARKNYLSIQSKGKL